VPLANLEETLREIFPMPTPDTSPEAKVTAERQQKRARRIKIKTFEC
jgi:hypothetical protein